MGWDFSSTVPFQHHASVQGTCPEAAEIASEHVLGVFPQHQAAHPEKGAQDLSPDWAWLVLPMDSGV